MKIDLKLKGGWWYRHCHNANLNGEFNLGMTWFDVSTRSWVHVTRSRMSLRRMMSNNRKECNEKKASPDIPTPFITTKTPHPETNRNEIASTKESERIPDYRANDKPLSNTNDPLKRNVYFLNKVSQKHRLHTNYKIMSQQHDNRDYPDYNLYENYDSELYYDDM